VVSAAAGLEVATGADLVGALSLLVRPLFGSEMNASGDLAGRLSGWQKGPLMGSNPGHGIGVIDASAVPQTAPEVVAAPNRSALPLRKGRLRTNRRSIAL
jgi:hypothetical protein